VPSVEQQELRDLARLRTTLVQDRARLVNRIHKVLEEAGVKLSSVLTDILGVSGRAILRALIAGSRDPERLASLAHKRLRRKHEQLVAVLQSDMQTHHGFRLAGIAGGDRGERRTRLPMWNWRFNNGCARLNRPWSGWG
jgi:transposase